MSLLSLTLHGVAMDHQVTGNMLEQVAKKLHTLVRWDMHTLLCGGY